MDALELRRLLAAGENLHCDFKREFHSYRELAKDLVCFANTDGGVLLFGIEDDGTVLGVEEPERLAMQIDEAAFEHCEPPVTVLTEFVQVREALVVAARVPRGDARPYRTKSGQFYVRTAARCRQASREELLRLFQATESLYYDELPVARSSLADLDLDALTRFLADAGLEDLAENDAGPLLRSWRLWTGDQATVAGILLLGRRPQEWLPHAQVNAAVFAGTATDGDPTDRTDITGRLLDIVQQVEAYLRLHLRTPHVVADFEREPQPELPLTALREAVVNALAHRDYTVRGPVRLFVLDDRIEVHSPGTTPNTVDEPAMRAGVHVVRNPHVYARLSDAGLVTRAGTGIRRISRMVRAATGRDVDISIRDYEVLLVIPRPIPAPSEGT